MELLNESTRKRESFKHVTPILDKLVNIACDIYEAGNHASFALTGALADEIGNSIRLEYAEVEQRLAASKYTMGLEIEKAVASVKAENTELKAQLANVKSAVEISVMREKDKYTAELNALRMENQKIANDFKAYSLQANGAFENMKVQLAASQEKEKMSEVLGKMYGNATVVGGVVKGELAEEHIYNALCESQYMGAIVRRVGKTAHTCDISFAWRNLVALIEVKNYNGTIPDSEFQKFERDLLGSVNAEINCGIFISMANKTIGKYNTFAHAWLNDRILAVYMFLDGNVANLAYAIDVACGLIDERKRAEESVSGDEDVLIAKFKEYYSSMTQKHKSLEQQIKHHTSMLGSLNSEMTIVSKTLTDLTLASTGKTWLSDSTYIISGSVLEEKMRPKLMPLFDYTCAGNMLTAETIKSFLGAECDILGLENVRSTLMEMIANAVISPGGYDVIFSKYKSGKELQLVKLQELKMSDEVSVINGTRYKLLKHFGKPLNIIKDSFDRYIKARLGI